jgi:hypothetical protein
VHVSFGSLQSCATGSHGVGNGRQIPTQLSPLIIPVQACPLGHSPTVSLRHMRMHVEPAPKSVHNSPGAQAS